MQLKPEKYADPGCWISDDRLYAFVSAADHCVAEIGYHGPQPVSRNSRVFVGEPAVLRFSLRTHDGSFSPVRFGDFDWYAGGVSIKGRCGANEVVLDLTAADSRLLISVSAPDSPLDTVCMRFCRSALFEGVHGERAWSAGAASSEWWEISFRDRILLNEWLKRTGPYAGDFLIPEPLRRRILLRPIRSGLATIEDVRPEFRYAPLPVYDAEVTIRIGGPGTRVAGEGEDVLLSAHRLPGSDMFPPMEVSFQKPGQPSEDTRETIKQKREHYGNIFRQAPHLSHLGHPRFEEFLPTVPPLVESCVIREYGIPRATPGRYYWIWAWDAMVTALAAQRWGACTLAENTAEFVNAHRDRQNIPMRWTRSLEPLDTQPRGALESLLASLAYTTALETGRESFLAFYHHFVDHFRTITASSDARGLFPNIGFYPDLPYRFGRTDSSAVALEVGCFYTFCRTLENMALLAGDPATASGAGAAAALLEETFRTVFWDDQAGFLCDAIDLQTGARNLKHPLFSLLFLQSPLGWPLVRERVAPLADFISQHLLSEDGMRVLPAGESSSETVANAWYPHWDVYALRVLRRGQRRDEILRWLRAAERTLDRLGFCPEYVAWLPEADAATGGAMQHGSPSNLNCITGWYQAFLEGVVGLESDPGGLTVVPLSLALGDYSLKGIVYRGTRWNVTVRNRGEKLQSIMVDGSEHRGSMKLPAKFLDGGEHALVLTYGHKEESPLFREVTNAEVIEARAEGNSPALLIRALGRCDVLYSASEDASLMLDGRPVGNVRRLPEGFFAASLPIAGEHFLRIYSPRSASTGSTRAARAAG